MAKKTKDGKRDYKAEQLRTAQAKRRILEALEKSLGIVTTACRKADVGRRTFYTWYNEDPEFAEKVDDTKFIVDDFGESQLLSLVSERQPSSVIFFAKTRLGYRGYRERVEQVVTQGGKFDDMSDEEIREAKDELIKRHNERLKKKDK